MKIGWIGTGVMGKSMCKHLMDKGHKLSVFTRTASKAEDLLQAGAQWSTISDIASQNDVVILMLGYPKDLSDVVFNQGLLSNMKPGTLLIDHTTSSPKLAREIYEKAKEGHVQSIDAPVSGGDVGAKNGQLVVMCGGEQAAFEQAKPIFEVYGKTVNLLGGAGMGQHCKMSNQIAIAGQMIGVCESLVYGHRAGLDLDQLLATIGGGAAGSFGLTNYGPRILKGDYQPGFYVEHFVKDLEIALDEAREMNMSLPGLALVHQLYRSLMAQGGGRLGTQALMKALQTMNGVQN